MEFIDRKMAAGLKKSAENGVALGGLLQADALEMAVKYLLSLADHLTGNGGLIIDTLLQHDSVVRAAGSLPWPTGGHREIGDRCKRRRIRIAPAILKMKFIFTTRPVGRTQATIEDSMSTAAPTQSLASRRLSAARIWLWV